ncbi:MAG TPA: DUF1285 domain-containing protein [Syntrophales bacterium]|nr:DUF1285 domain-containing protein [Syntrophales bacterium]HOM07058.1 DUF1285 domain-containing protein [Syntrophales bacterium]HON98905.1 DUF1285 domain-containing protein [Syntrophales bacterium]HPC00369.1 DUF1285 domain-containing protein [Syntrophales bacterium]HPQ06573.1 DUF1285 domain-containing protein [Syntrophales bacterium]
MAKIDVPTSDIRIDKDGVWYYRGAEMHRREIVNFFYDHLKMDPQGRYLIELPEDRCYIQVEDTAYVVHRVMDGQGGEKGRLRILLSDGSVEPLDPKTLEMNEKNVLYCRVRNGAFPARFSRPAYYQLADHLSYDDKEGRFYLDDSGERHYIKRKN